MSGGCVKTSLNKTILRECINLKIKIIVITNQACCPLLIGNLQLLSYFYNMYINSMAFLRSDRSLALYKNDIDLHVQV